MSRVSRKCGSLGVSQRYGPSLLGLLQGQFYFSYYDRVVVSCLVTPLRKFGNYVDLLKICKSIVDIVNTTRRKCLHILQLGYSAATAVRLYSCNSLEVGHAGCLVSGFQSDEIVKCKMDCTEAVRRNTKLTYSKGCLVTFFQLDDTTQTRIVT
jgi:hypothetical protein